MVLRDCWFEALAGRPVGHRVHCSQGLKFLCKTGETATLRLDEAVTGGITNFREADNKLTDRGLSTEGCSFPRHVMGATSCWL